MKVVILCGGKGIRMHELTGDIPKPLVEIGDRPMLWHIMKIYSHYGFCDFILLLGYKGEKIKEYFMDYTWKNHDIVLCTEPSHYSLLHKPEEKWRITLLDTGMETMTGGRVKKAQEFIGNEPFMLTYGDGLSDISIPELLDFHNSKGAIATVTGIYKKSQYGILTVKDGIAQSFAEKVNTDRLINGGFFVMNPEVFDYLGDDPGCVLEKEPLENLTTERQLAVYVHKGFWTAMDTYRDITAINDMWQQGNHPWKVW